MHVGSESKLRLGNVRVVSAPVATIIFARDGSAFDCTG